jgi:hypothetical protein
MNFFRKLLGIVKGEPAGDEGLAFRLTPPPGQDIPEAEEHEYDQVLPRIRVNYAHEIYRDDASRDFANTPTLERTGGPS